MIEKANDVEAKASLQPPFKIRKIDSRYPKSHRPSVKKGKNNANWEYRDENKDQNKAKSQNPSSANSQPQTQVFKKDKHQESRQGGYPATEVNAIKVAKRDKDKAKDLSYIKCYTCKQKSHYANKCPKKPKNE